MLSATSNNMVRSYQDQLGRVRRRREPIDLLRRRLSELADRETRLLLAGVGERYPHEVLVNVDQFARSPPGCSP